MTDTVQDISEPALPDSVRFVPRTELEARLSAIERRLGRVEQASTDMANAQATLQQTIHDNTEKLDNILAFLTHANSAWGFIRKHGPKIGYVVVGVAISRGWVTADNGKNILHVLGFA